MKKKFNFSKVRCYPCAARPLTSPPPRRPPAARAWLSTRVWPHFDLHQHTQKRRTPAATHNRAATSTRRQHATLPTTQNTPTDHPEPKPPTTTQTLPTLRARKRPKHRRTSLTTPTRNSLNTQPRPYGSPACQTNFHLPGPSHRPPQPARHNARPRYEPYTPHKRKPALAHRCDG